MTKRPRIFSSRFLSGVIRRIHGKPLDKAEDMRFKYMSPEQCAETAADADRETATERRTRHG